MRKVGVVGFSTNAAVVAKMPRRVVSLVTTSLLSCALAGCAGFADTDNDRAQLEGVLLRTSTVTCGTPGTCRRARTIAAECMGDGLEYDGRRFYRCAMRMQGPNDSTHVEYVCAALAETGNRSIARELRDCGPRGS